MKRGDLQRVFLVALALTVFLRVPAFFVDVFNSDEPFVATQAQVIRHGGSLYTEAVDRHPPLVPYLYAGAFAVIGNDDLWSPRVLAMVAAALTALLLAIEARRRYGRGAEWTAGLLAVFALVAFAPQDGQSANFEIFMLAPMTAAVLLARRGRAGQSGVAVAVASLAKQTGALTLLPVLYLAWRDGRAKPVLRVLLGFAAPLVAVALLMGPSDFAYWTLLGNGSYLGITAATFALVAFAKMTAGWAGCNVPMLWHAPAAWRARHRDDRDGGTDTDLWLWLASAVVAVLIGLRFLGHYYFQLVPPLCLLATGALTRASHRAVVITVGAAAIMAVAFSAAGYFMHPFGAEPPYAAVSRYVDAHSRVSDRILVWGNVPEIYWSSHRLPATRYPATQSLLLGNHPARPAREPSAAELDTKPWHWFYDDLDAHPPRFIVDTSPAAIRGAQHTPITDFPRLHRMVDREYRLVRTVHRIAIYEHVECGRCTGESA